MSFSALYLTYEDSSVRAEIRSLEESALPEGDVLVRVLCSSLNYKDALAITQGPPVVRSFPMVPGIDLAGMVEQSSDERFQIGEKVLVNGWGLGEQHWGGLAELARVPGDFLTPLPPGLDCHESMAIGTAGYTAMLSVLKLEKNGVQPGDGDILVTGASGGVGSTAIALLAGRGFRVVASTGRTDEADYLRSLGAAEILHRNELSSPGKPLQKERWAAAIDSVGGSTLANICASLRYRGHVTACGLAQSMDLPASVAPFILRNITLHGIDSVRAPQADREEGWRRLAADLDRDKLRRIATKISLREVVAAAEDLLAGKIRGRVVVDVPT